MSQRRLQAIKLCIPINLMMTGKLRLLASYYQYIQGVLSASLQEQKCMEVSFSGSFHEEQILTAIYQDLQRWRSDSIDATSEQLKCNLIQSLVALFPKINLASELENINLGTTLCDDIRHETGDYSLNRIAYPPYERPKTPDNSDDEASSEELSKIWDQFIRRADNYDEIRKVLTSPIKPDV